MKRPRKKRIRVKQKTREGEFSFDWCFDDAVEDLAAGLLGLGVFFARRLVPDFDGSAFRELGRERMRQKQAGTWRKTLGLSGPVTRGHVIARFRELARRHHPDHGGDTKRFVELVAARDAALAELAA